MKSVFAILFFVVLSLYFTSEGFAQTREEVTASSEQFTKTTPELKSSSLEKISKQILEWQSSSNPQAYARDNGMIVSDGKIQVYVHLDSAESIADIPQDVEITGSDANIAVAFVNTRQISQLAQLDSVIQISSPITAVPRATEREPVEMPPKLNDPKISSVILEWMGSSNPEMVAKNNNLIVSDGKIQVYVHLDSAESIADIPQDVEITGSDANIAVAFVNTRQISQLAQLDSVVQVSPPIQATVPPVPTPQATEQDDGFDFGAIGIGIGIIIAIIVGIILLRKRSAQK